MMDMKIECSTHSNGYALSVNDKEYYYHSVERLLIGAAWHIRHEAIGFCDVDDVIDVLLGHKQPKAVASFVAEMQEHITCKRALKKHNDEIRKKYNECRKENTKLKNELKRLKNGIK